MLLSHSTTTISFKGHTVIIVGTQGQMSRSRQLHGEPRTVGYWGPKSYYHIILNKTKSVIIKRNWNTQSAESVRFKTEDGREMIAIKNVNTPMAELQNGPPVDCGYMDPRLTVVNKKC